MKKNATNYAVTTVKHLNRQYANMILLLATQKYLTGMAQNKQLKNFVVKMKRRAKK